MNVPHKKKVKKMESEECKKAREQHESLVNGLYELAEKNKEISGAHFIYGTMQFLTGIAFRAAPNKKIATDGLMETLKYCINNYLEKEC